MISRQHQLKFHITLKYTIFKIYVKAWAKPVYYKRERRAVGESVSWSYEVCPKYLYERCTFSTINIKEREGIVVKHMHSPKIALNPIQ